MATIQDVNSSIMFGNFTNDQLDSILAAIKFRRAELVRSTARSLSLGSQVTFTGRQGVTYTGTIEAIKIKNAVVNTNRGRYRVPMNMLTAV